MRSDAGRRVGAVLLVVLGVLLGTSTAALAHGETGTAEVLLAEAPDGREARIEVGVLYDDGDQAEEALVTVTLRSPDGAGFGPIVLARLSGGRYGGTIPVNGPGTWGIEILSIDPNVKATASFSVPPAGATTSTTEGRATTTTAASTGEADPQPVLPATDEILWANVVLIGLVVAAGVAAAIFVTRRRRRRA